MFSGSSEPDAMNMTIELQEKSKKNERERKEKEEREKVIMSRENLPLDRQKRMGNIIKSTISPLKPPLHPSTSPKQSIRPYTTSI